MTKRASRSEAVKDAQDRSGSTINHYTRLRNPHCPRDRIRGSTTERKASLGMEMSVEMGAK